MSTPAVPAPLRFGRFELQPLEGRLLVDGEPAAIGGRAFDVLQLLVERAGALVTRNELIERAWPRVVVEENNLNVQINALRRVLGPEVIVTVPGRGYRLGVPVRAVSEPAAAPAAVVAPMPASAPRSHLPQALPPLFGRDEDLAALSALVAQHRLVTLVGAGGVGKSRLAQALLQARAAHLPHGVCWVDLHAAVDADALPGAVGTALGLLRAPGDALPSLVRACAGLELLVALDNAETQLDAVATMARALLDGVPGLRLLVTSQAPLRLADEHVQRLAPLAVPEPGVAADEARRTAAVALFVERAQAADSRFQLHDAQVPVAAELCRRLDGLPLAIELAAARVPVMGLAVLLDSLNDRLRVLTANRNRHAPARQQTLRDTLAWSYGLLGPLEQALFRALAVASGSVSLTLVQGLMAGHADGAADAWAVLDALDQLVQRSLVDALHEDGWSAPRYRLLESPRALALELLRAEGEEAALRQRHAEAVLAEYEQHEQALLAGAIGVAAWRQDGEPMLADAQQARPWAQSVGQPRLALALARVAVARVLDQRHLEMAAAVRLCVEMFERDLDLDPRLACRTWLALDRFAFREPARWCAAADHALDLAQRLGSSDEAQFLQHSVWCEAGRVAAAEQQLELAAARLDRARQLEQADWPPFRRRGLPRAEAFLAMAQGQPALALQRLRHVLVISQQAGDPSLATQLNIADMELLAGDAAAAVATGTALVEVLAAGRAMELLAVARINLAAAHLALDQLPQARELLLPAWRAAPNFDRPWPHLDGCHRLGALLAALEGRPEAAARLLGYADGLHRSARSASWGNEAAARERCIARLQATLSAERLQMLVEEGVQLDATAAMALAFDTG